jgi:starch synthase
MALPLTLLLAPQAYRLDPQRPLGRESAGAGFLEAYLRFGGNRRHHLVVADRSHGDWFHQEACRYQREPETVLAGLGDWGAAAGATGAIALPGPGLDEWAWKRMPCGDGQFSLVGLVHTLCSRPVQWGLGQFSTAPVRPWDALICTSSAARKVVEGFLERQETWLGQRIGATRFERPQLPVIPLGVHPEAWTPPGGKTAAQAQARQELGLASDAVVVLLAGRLDVLTKFHPGPLLRVLADLQQHELPKLQLLIYGEAPNEGMAELWRNGLQQAAPTLPVHWVAGRQLELAGPVRWAADLFVSLADNPQETFGITPLEAMAAELPCLVSDWDGYRDTVTATEGDRVPTQLIEGLGQEEAQGLLSETLSYDLAVGRVAQGIAVDPALLRAKLLNLLSNPERLRQLGQNGRERVRQQFSWEVVISQWHALLLELEGRRHAAKQADETGEPAEPPWLPSCSTGFRAFASKVVRADQALHWTRPEAAAMANARLRETLDGWDHALMQEFIRSDNLKPDQLPARLKGWLLKQGLACTHPPD